MSIAGIEPGAVSAWIAERIDVTLPLRFAAISGGNSNLTFRVDDAAGRALALRRPPLGQVLESAHDMSREFRVISALFGTDVPVPEPLALCEDPAINDAPFYVMAFVEGVVPHDAEGGAAIPKADRVAVGEAAIDVLAALHRLDPDEVGLGDLGRREDYVARQLRRWTAQWDASKQREIAAMDEARHHLESAIPPQQRSTVVHGDYRLGNMIIGGGGVEALLDWELCTLGDPMADVGYLMNSWMGPEEPVIWRSSATQAGGFPDRGRALARYAAATGADTSRIGYYRAFQSWRLAAILEGVYARYRHGAMGSAEGLDLDLMARSVVQLAEQAVEQLAA